MAVSDWIALGCALITVCTVVYQGGRLSQKLEGVCESFNTNKNENSSKFKDIDEHFLRVELHLQATDKSVQENSNQLQYMSGMVKTSSGAHLERL